MKKLLFVIMILTVTGIAGIFAQDQFWQISKGTEGAKSRNNQIALSAGDNEIVIHFRGGKPGADFDKLKIDFTISSEADVMWYAAFVDGAVWSRYPGGTKRPDTLSKYEGITNGPVETDFADMVHTFYNYNPRTIPSLIKKDIKLILIIVTLPRGTRNATFTMNSVEFIGLK